MNVYRKLYSNFICRKIPIKSKHPASFHLIHFKHPIFFNTADGSDPTCSSIKMTILKFHFQNTKNADFTNDLEKSFQIYCYH